MYLSVYFMILRGFFKYFWILYNYRGYLGIVYGFLDIFFLGLKGIDFEDLDMVVF